MGNTVQWKGYANIHHWEGVECVNFSKLTWWLLIIGGLNWGLVGLANYNVVAQLGGSLARVVYLLVGLSALYSLFSKKM